jgi:hypothetical protein
MMMDLMGEKMGVMEKSINFMSKNWRNKLMVFIKKIKDYLILL